MPGAEGLPVAAQLLDVGREQAHPERAGLAASGQSCPLQGLRQALVQRAQIVPQLFTQPREPDAAAVPREKLGTDGSFLLLDRLADPGHGDVQPLGGAAEVQLLGQGQEDLDVP